METPEKSLEVEQTPTGLSPEATSVENNTLQPSADQQPTAEDAAQATEAQEEAAEIAASAEAEEAADATEPTAETEPVAEPVSELVAEPVSEPENEAEDAPETKAEERESLKSKEDVLQALALLASDEVAELSRDEVNHLKAQFYNFRKAELEAELEAFVAAGNDAAAFMPQLCPAEDQLKELLNTIKEKKAAQLAAHEAMLQANLERKKALIDELIALSADTDNVNRAFPRVKEIQTEYKAIGEVPATEATDQWKAYQTAVEQFYDQLKVNKDLRDYDFRKNLELKTMLCEEAEKLDGEEDIVLAFKRLQNLHDEWRQIGPVAKELREEIWTRFKDASTVVNKKYQTFFEERKAKETENEAAKTALCEKVEALDFTELKNFAAWDEMTKAILAIQEEWKGIGFASRKANNALFARFREACDKFFAAKSDFYKAVKDELADNLAKKIALCEKAEALQDSTDWRKTADTLVALQKEWKTIGAVTKKHSDAVWERFQKACDKFFENRKKNYNDSRSQEQTNLQAKRELIEELKAIPADTPRSEAMPKVKDIQARWQQVGHVPFREKDKLYEEYRALCDAFYARNRQARGGVSRFEDVINEMGSDENKLYRERERIMRAYEIKRNELKTYENNLGFLTSKSKSGDSMVREMERRIQRIKDDLAAIEAKIKLIDEKL